MNASVTTTTSNPWRVFFILGVDLIILAELCIAIRQAAMTPDMLTPVFMKTFFAMLLPTLVVCYAIKRWMRSKSERTAS
jgi:hypothetical protein